MLPTNLLVTGATDDLLLEVTAIELELTELGVTEGTVRGRIKRLQQERLITFTAITGLQMASNSRLAFIWVQAEVERTREVARQIHLGAVLEEVRRDLERAAAHVERHAVRRPLAEDHVARRHTAFSASERTSRQSTQRPGRS